MSRVGEQRRIAIVANNCEELGWLQFEQSTRIAERKICIHEDKPLLDNQARIDFHQDHDRDLVIIAGMRAASVFRCEHIEYFALTPRLAGQWNAAKVFYVRFPDPKVMMDEMRVEARLFWERLRECPVHGWWEQKGEQVLCPDCDNLDF